MPVHVPTTSGPLTDAASFADSPLEQVRTLYVSFLQGLFAAAPAGYYHWTGDETTEILITDENPLRSETIGQRPCITFSRGPVQFQSLGLDDLLFYDPRTETKRKSVLVPGTAVLNCCSRVPLECERLAWIVAENLWMHRELLLRAGFFEVGRQPTCGAPSPAGSIIAADNGDEWYTTAVSCPFQFYRTSQRTPLNQRVVQSIAVSLQTRMRAVRPAGYPPGDRADPGYQVCGVAPPGFLPGASDVHGATPAPGGAASAPLGKVPHPFNPAQTVFVRAARPGSPGPVRPPSMRGRPIPIVRTAVEDSCPRSMPAHVTDPWRVLV